MEKAGHAEEAASSHGADTPTSAGALTPRSSVFADGESDFGSSPDNEPLYTPQTSHFGADVPEDLPPTYEQAQAALFNSRNPNVPYRDSVDDLNVYRLSLDPASTVTLPQYSQQRNSRLEKPAASDVASSLAHSQHSVESVLDQALHFTRVPPPPDATAAPRLSRCITIPAVAETSDDIPLFIRAYCEVLRTHSIEPAEFVAFIESLNVLLETSTDPDPTHEDTLPSIFLSRANREFFGPRRLIVRLCSPAELAVTISLSHGSINMTVDQTSLPEPCPIPVAKEVVQSLEPLVEPLIFDVPAANGQTLALQAMRLGHRRSRSVDSNTTLQNDPPVPGPSSERRRNLQHSRSQPQGWDDWGQALDQRAETWGRGFGRGAEVWGTGFGRKWENWGDDFGKKMEAWGHNLGKKFSAGPPGGHFGSNRDAQRPDVHGPWGQGPWGLAAWGPQGAWGPGAMGRGLPWAAGPPMGVRNMPRHPITPGTLGREVSLAGAPSMGGQSGVGNMPGHPIVPPHITSPHVFRAEVQHHQGRCGPSRGCRHGRHKRHGKRDESGTSSSSSSSSDDDDSHHHRRGGWHRRGRGGRRGWHHDSESSSTSSDDEFPDSSSDDSSDEDPAEVFAHRLQQIEEKSAKDLTKGKKDPSRISLDKGKEIQKAETDRARAETKWERKQNKRQIRAVLKENKRQIRNAAVADRKQLKVAYKAQKKEWKRQWDAKRRGFRREGKAHRRERHRERHEGRRERRGGRWRRDEPGRGRGRGAGRGRGRAVEEYPEGTRSQDSLYPQYWDGDGPADNMKVWLVVENAEG